MNFRLLPFVLLLFFNLLNGHSLFAQPAATVKGRITSTAGEALGKASVTIKGTGKGTSTDAEGRFEIAAAPGSTLIISLVGYTSREIVTTASAAEITVQLSLNSTQLDQVVVVGYGTQKKSDITGAVTSVPKDRLSKIPVTNVLQDL